MWRALIVCLVVTGLSCASAGRTASQAAAQDPFMSLALAGVVGTARRMDGDCFTVCPTGTTCNRKTGYCDTLPCHGQCQDNERCDESGLFPRCVADGSKVFLAIGGDAGVPERPGSYPP